MKIDDRKAILENSLIVRTWIATVADILTYLSVRMVNYTFQYIGTPLGICNIILVVLVIINALAVTFSPRVKNFYTNIFGESYGWLLCFIWFFGFLLNGDDREDIIGFVLFLIVLIVFVGILYIKRDKK